MMTTPTIPEVDVKEPFYQAIGWLKGSLVYSPPDPEAGTPGRILSLTLEDGTTLKCSGVRQNLLQWAARHPDELHGVWCVYPRQSKDGLSVFLSNRWIQAEAQDVDNIFRVQGRVTRVKEGSLIVAIERNLRAPETKEKLLAWREFTLKLHGDYSFAEGSFCQVVCRLVKGKLKIESARPIAGKPKPKTRSKDTKPKQQVSSPEQARPLVQARPVEVSEVPQAEPVLSVTGSTVIVRPKPPLLPVPSPAKANKPLKRNNRLV